MNSLSMISCRSCLAKKCKLKLPCFTRSWKLWGCSSLCCLKSSLKGRNNIYWMSWKLSKKKRWNFTFWVNNILWSFRKHYWQTNLKIQIRLYCGMHLIKHGFILEYIISIWDLDRFSIKVLLWSFCKSSDFILYSIWRKNRIVCRFQIKI